MEVSRCCWRVISAKVCPSQGTHTAKQTETEKRNRNGQRRQCRAELIRQGKVEKVEKAFLRSTNTFLECRKYWRKCFAGTFFERCNKVEQPENEYN